MHPLEGLSTTSTPAGPSGQSISAADCAEVTDMIAAVELRTDPTQCNFQPALNPNTPALCANQKNPPVHYLEDFEDGLAGWTLTNHGCLRRLAGHQLGAMTRRCQAATQARRRSARTS